MSEFTMFPVAGPHAGAPRLIGTFSYSDFTASGTYAATMVGELNRQAVARSFIIANTMDEAITSLTFWLFDSTLDTYSNSGSGQSFADSNGVKNGAYAQYTSEAPNSGLLAFHGDSIMIDMTMGATAPTSGEVQVYVVELFH